jgi:glycerophosphoryl diester phosphodiesterase
LTLPVKDAFEYRYAIGSDKSATFLNISAILSMIPKESKFQNDGNFGVLLDVELPTEQSAFTYLTFTLSYPDYYMSSPKHPRLGLQLPKATSISSPTPTTSVYTTSSTSLWNGSSKILDSTHDLTASTTFTLSQPNTLSHVQFDIHAQDSHVGVVTVLSSQLTAFHGVITSPIVDSSSSVIGNITFHYAVATPFSHPSFGLKSTTRKSFPAKPTLVGHRGSGAEGSRTQFQGSPRSHIRENTLLSFEKAGAMGAHFVEFDVHLTSDSVPVIYHDFTVPHSTISVPIHSLTLEEFKKIGSKVITKTNSLNNLLAQPPQQQSPSAHDPTSTTIPEPIFDSFPTLRETLTRVPPNIGFNIEVKYPIKDELEKYNIRPVDRNKYIDCILWDVFECAKDREIVFSSFDPGILF